MVQGPPELAKELAEAFPGFDRRVAPPVARPDAEPDDAQRRQDPAGPGRPEGEVRRRRRPLPGPEAEVSATSASPSETGTTGRRADAEADRGGVPGRARSSEGRRELSATTTSAAPRGPRSSAPRRARRCHPNTFAKWATTKHAQAFEALGPKPERQPPVRRRVRQLPHDRLRVQLGVPRRPSSRRTSRATSARTATARARSTPRSPTTRSSASSMAQTAANADKNRPLHPLPRRGQLAPVRLHHVLGQDRPQGHRQLQRSQGPPGDQAPGTRRQSASQVAPHADRRPLERDLALGDRLIAVSLKRSTA